MHLGTKQQILPTLKFDYLKQMLEVNTGFLTFIFIIVSYMKIDLKSNLYVVFITAILSHIITYFIFTTKSQTNEV